ncbi:LysR family transcriptional regulator [Amphritea balenae]|uniref:LysR family transcriptional regulator n=1 Tax=Amphritea balenae TaxID=452629 RepID=A0A3P1SXL1_9GAMM|nr:LysR family transcriptional regulator [Amphritea balenae]RRD01286.1 LysR family transcriptional regulator [Amphritea balenae]GGK58429.1 LysR family transcriptional regulator [Amphritea balenae]
MRLPLSTLEVFDAIVREGSMRAAAQALGIKRSTVSHQLKSLEDQLGAVLFVRTTRSISLTEAGRVLARASGPAFEQLADGLESTRTEGHAARGTLKLAIPELAYHLLLSKHLVAFQKLYPEIEIELFLTDALSDILKEGLHAGFRLGGLIAQDMVAINLTDPMTSAVVASPDYLEKHGIPEHPMELLTHNCLRYRFQSSGQLAPWTFSSAEGDYPVVANGSLISNSMPVTLEMATQGLGITYTFRDYCADHLDSGQLKEILTEHRVTMPGVNIYFPQEYRSMAPLRLFIQHLKGSVIVPEDGHDR